MGTETDANCSIHETYKKLKNNRKMKNSGIIVSFHVGRGGRFHNAGHVTYLGEKNFQDLMNLNSDTLSIGNRDERGKFCKPYLTDGQSANVIQCMDIDELINELQKLSGNAQYIDVQTVSILLS